MPAAEHVACVAAIVPFVTGALNAPEVVGLKVSAWPAEPQVTVRVVATPTVAGLAENPIVELAGAAQVIVSAVAGKAAEPPCVYWILVVPTLRQTNNTCTVVDSDRRSASSVTVSVVAGEPSVTVCPSWFTTTDGENKTPTLAAALEVSTKLAFVLSSE